MFQSESKVFLMRKCRYLLYFLSECSRVWIHWKGFLIFYRLIWSNRKWRHFLNICLFQSASKVFSMSKCLYLLYFWSVFWYYYFFLFRNIVIDSCWPEYWQSYKRHCNARSRMYSGVEAWRSITRCPYGFSVAFRYTFMKLWLLVG